MEQSVASPALPLRRPQSRPPPPSAAPIPAVVIKTTVPSMPSSGNNSPQITPNKAPSPPTTAPSAFAKEEPAPLSQRKTFLSSIRKGTKKGPLARVGSETDLSKTSGSSSDLTSFSPMSSPAPTRLAAAQHTGKRWRKVAIGEAHNQFLSMMLHSCCGGGRAFLTSRVLQAQELVQAGDEVHKCCLPASDEFIMTWFTELTRLGGSLLPLSDTAGDLEIALPLAKLAYDALVVRAHQLKAYDELQSVANEQLVSGAAVLFTTEEILRLAGSVSSSLPRDRFNPYTHTITETVAHQRRSPLAQYRVPYLVANLTVAILRRGGLDNEGIFRINADSQALENLKRFIVTENWAEVAATEDVNVLSGALKSYFASMSGGALFPNTDQLVALGANCDWLAVAGVLRTLPKDNLHLIWWWVCLCRLFAAHENTTSMGLKQMVVCWAPCLVRQDLSSASLREISTANAVIQAVLLCTLESHPPHPLYERAKAFADTTWFPITASEFFAPFLKPRDADYEDFVELEEQYGHALLDEDNDYKGLLELLEQVPNGSLNECCDALFPYLWRRRCFFSVFQVLVERDIEQTKFLNSLFRLNSFVTKLLKNVIAQEGGAFLRSVLGPIMKDISRQNADMDSSTADDDERQARANLLSECCSMALCTITNSLAEISTPLRRVAEILGRLVTRKWPESEDAVPCAMSAFFFLRFVCPYFFNVPTSAPANATFTCKQIAKMLQAMANGGELSQAEWPKFNVELMSVHKARLDFFLRQTAMPMDADVDYGKVSEDDAINGFESFVKILRAAVPANLPGDLGALRGSSTVGAGGGGGGANPKTVLGSPRFEEDT